MNSLACLGFFALGFFAGMRWTANTHRIDKIAFRVLYTPAHDEPIPYPHIDQEYRA